MPRRNRLAQELAAEPLVSLYELDVSKYGGGVRYWTTGVMGESSLNVIWNPSAASSVTGWTADGSPATFQPARLVAGLSDIYKLPQVGNGAIKWASIPADTQRYLTWAPSTGALKVGAGQWVQGQAKVVTHQCKAKLILQFWNGASWIENHEGPWNTLAGGAADALSDYEVIWEEAQAPAGTTEVRMLVAVLPLTPGVAAADAWLFWTHALLAPLPNELRRPLEFGPGSKVGSVAFAGVTYQPIPVQMEGFERTGRGPVPRITITVPDVDNLATQLLAAYKDLLGCKITRRQVFRSALDDGAYPDPTDFYGPEVFYVDRVVKHVPGEIVVLECASPLDIQGTKIPNRQMIRDVCSHTYRHWTGGLFDYGSCPYNGGSYFRQDNVATGNPAEDRCSRSLLGCRARYGTDAVLPFKGFPGMGRTRI